MQLPEIFSAIEKIAPLEAAAPWDLSGLQVAAHRSEIEVLAVCLDPTPASVRQALELGAQCILSHHPLALKPALPRRLDAYHEVLRLLFAADVPLYAAHTSLDVNADGPASWLARELELRNLAVLDPTAPPPVEAALPLGFGLAGDLPTPLSLAQITSGLARHIELSTATVCGPMPEKISRLAYCTGSGSSLLREARASGAQLFITGDVKYHTALEAEICLLDVGHHSLEEEMMRRMSRLLAQRLDGLNIVFVPSASPLRPALLS
ncbi:Nif3-like dinuclear metal center hexameric protein [Desulfovibrio sp. PG-178-WT-4]|uniref:GTP cyclohydrolase 1 type 2 homolog n=1 Tax=Desulfovibrio porci TaxID=2605782 RepID=A0A6L5XPL2_9BACT|nr:Nif3-like dinuclear metal center hexameric protein [Desulfovibrio porci]MDY3808523.1 Nif3-like dinuclear metal center hexameric protein [Desulfovibrio porci]MSS29015.1 Nif3-like dinuclear metal center hexameric protein [Desulfovibrio porci]